VLCCCFDWNISDVNVACCVEEMSMIHIRQLTVMMFLSRLLVGGKHCKECLR